ncbi:PREDICTED: lysine-specific demethylase lid isoform X2 [Nicrophorus vespilloides]|uniref:[histone H3]-trimethyl-L-lysine(4) demethylase n=1 Tax=Nicrophorus vespilloides TaxID=110193 RepID=A0ABM1N884_NICVS|nr:PREDICTED: lysine-specific demethylase lid isoform X2 [Nicrophorus vespilloides]
MSGRDERISPTLSNTGSCSNDSSAKSTRQDVFEFAVPPEAPVFSPTEAEFAEPLVFIDKIRPIAEKYGICKIKPPPNWQPPFAVDVDKLKFTPRIQRLNELEAKTRIKLNFLDQIAKFWELQGSSLKIPMVEKRALDLYTLHRLVEHEGGFSNVSKERKWAKVAVYMGYPQGKGIGTILKTHYERLLYPFEVFAMEKKIIHNIKQEIKTEDDEDQEYKPSKSRLLNTQPTVSRKNCYSRRSKGTAAPEPEVGEVVIKVEVENVTIKEEPTSDSESDHNKELKRLQFYGPGPKMAGFNLKKNDDFKPRPKSEFDFDPLAKYICHNCRRGDSEEQMLLCDGCDDSYHTFCLMPPLAEIPKGDWCCPKCVAAEVSKPMEAFGFEQAQREYNLQQFGEMADTFKSEYFNMPVHLVPTSMVEKEFWRIVSSIDEDVTVEYGADLHTMDHGSGFPTKNALNLLPADHEYALSGWNLNNLPVLEGSVLGYINADISGMKVPWMYVGMCFATFCWHNEDHWSYSINYLHWGEPKTWYGVSGMKAELFEETMKSAAPELFQTQPDLLHQLVTIMNPNILMNAGVPVYRTDQHAGEFVITFPRAYHAGFNQGYNFAEAVNFAPADWVAMGRECVLHYSQLRRFCVFSHDELVCKMATNSEKLDITVAAATYTDMLRMVETEKKLRKSLLDWGVTSAEREAFELLPDDERQCEVCKTTCFMSALTCACTADVLVCLRHYASLCKCPPSRHTLRYRYTLDELLPLLRSLKQKAESFDRWADRVKDVLDRKNPKSVDLSELRALLAEADGKNFPKSDLLQTLAHAIEDAEKCASVIKQLDFYKIRTRYSCDNRSKLTLQELRLFCDEIDSLACILDEETIIKELLKKTDYFELESRKYLEMEVKDCPLKEVEELIEFSNGLCIQLPTLKPLKDRYIQLRWVKDVIETRKKTPEVAEISTLNNLLRRGFSLPADPLIEETLSDLQALITDAEDWEEQAQALFAKQGVNIVTEAENLIKIASGIDVYLPTENLLVDSVNSVNGWFKELQEINSLEFYPYLTAIEDLVKKSKNFTFHLDEVERLKTYIASAHSWKERTSKTFLLKNSFFTLMESLSPRTQLYPNKNKKKPSEENTRLAEIMDPVSVVTAFKDAEDKEMQMVKDLISSNTAKKIDAEDTTFCTCQKAVSGVMMQCVLCKDWFHSSCVQLPKLATDRLRKNIKPMSLRIGVKNSKFLCINCQRTRRPRLETILGLLMSLQKLHSRLPEGEALQCLTERAMNWQDRARQFIQSPEIAPAMSKLLAMEIKYKITKRENMPPPPPPPPLDSKPQPEKSIQDSTVSAGTGIIDEDISDSTIQSLSDDDMEHAYSMTFSKQEEAECTITINQSVREQILELITEGDLLEVSLDENDQLWQLNLLSRDLEQEPLIIDFDAVADVSTATVPISTPVKKGKKRRSEEPETSGCKVKRDVTSKKVRVPRKTKENTIRQQSRKRKSKANGETKSDEEEDDDEGDEDAMCAVSTCLQPSGDEVDWVQCDGGCEQWFHMACVGLSAKDINEDEDYICSTCSPDTEKLKSMSETNELHVIELKSLNT